MPTVDEGDDSKLRAELLAAKAKIERQLEILQSPASSFGFADNRGVTAELQEELAEIEAGLKRIASSEEGPAVP